MRIDFEAAVQKLRESDDFLLLTHRNPDGDAVGSLWALCRALRGIGKRVTFRLAGRVADNMLFAAEQTDDSFEPQCIVSVDLAEAHLLGEELFGLYGDKIDLNIDHHGSNTLFAKQTLLREHAAAAAVVVYQLFAPLGATLDLKAAEQLYLGISTDTGCFRYHNTDADCLRATAALLEAGVNNGEINRIIFETKSKAYIQFESLALNSMRMCLDGKCAVMTLTQDMYQKTGLDESEIHMISALPRQIEGVLVGVTIKEKENGLCRVSLRTNEPVDASSIAKVFGGGGHKLAAGCDLYGSLRTATADLLKAIEAALKEYNLL